MCNDGYDYGVYRSSFYVGKTMTANAVANYLKKKILLVTVSVMVERDLTKVCLAVCYCISIPGDNYACKCSRSCFDSYFARQRSTMLCCSLMNVSHSLSREKTE